MKGWIYLLVWSIGLCLPASMWADIPMRTDTIPASAIESPQEKQPRHPHDQIINFGAKGGFTASLFLVSDFSINGQEIKEVQNTSPSSMATTLSKTGRIVWPYSVAPKYAAFGTARVK